MVKSPLTRHVLLALLLCLGATAVRAQTADTAAREVVWQAYRLPEAPFARYTDPDNALVFRAPADWKRVGETLVFTSGENVRLQVVPETIPDGVPIRAYVAALLEQLRKLPGESDMVSVRRAQISGFEAREIMFDIADPHGGVSRRIIFSVVEGPRAVSFLLTEPLARAAEIEPLLKAVVESTVLLGELPDSLGFELLRAANAAWNKPARIDPALALIPALDGLAPAERLRAVVRLTELFARSPEAAIDLLIDRRVMVRAAAVEALGASGNRELDAFLLRALTDRDAFVADRAAAALATLPDPVAQLRKSTDNWISAGFQEMMNASAHLDSKACAQIASELFQTANQKQAITDSLFKMVGGPGKGIGKVTVKAKDAPSQVEPPPPPPMERKSDAAKNPKVTGEQFEALMSADSLLFLNKQFIAVNLLRRVPAAELKTPLAEIVASHADSVVAAALETALERRERLPLKPLLALLRGSSREDIRRDAALCVAESASLADLAQLEAMERLERERPASARPRPNADSPSEPAPETTSEASKLGGASPSSRKTADLLQLAIKLIRLRVQLEAAEREARRHLIQQAMADAAVADWTWRRYGRDEFEGPRDIAPMPARPPISAPERTAAMVISPLGENAFPAAVHHYVALPRPGAAIERLVGSLTNLQAPSARSQADLTLALSAWGEKIAAFLGASGDGPPLDYLGIKLDAPIAMASWAAQPASPPVQSAGRKAVVLRVTDPQRFERFLTIYERQFGNFSNLPDYAAIGVRFISLAPAILPIGANLLTGTGPARQKRPERFKFDYIGRDRCLGYPVKVIAQLEIQGRHITRDAIYLAYVGDAAVLAPDWDSLRDVLTRIAGGGANLSENPEFKRAAAEGGDAIYFSDAFRSYVTGLAGAPLTASDGKSAVATPVAATIATPIASGTAGAVASDDKLDDNLIERGALRLSAGAWENTFQLSFKGSQKLDGTVPFKPSALEAPRRLLPRSTFAYVFLGIDPAISWRGWLGELVGTAGRKALAAIWALDFERDVLPELGPECGAALLRLPGIGGEARGGEGWNVPAVLFFKLKSDKLARAFAEGKLLRDAPAKESIGRVKLGSSEFSVTVRDGFLVLAADEAALKQLVTTEKAPENQMGKPATNPSGQPAGSDPVPLSATAPGNLADARDFGRAAQAAPDGIFVFGGYSLEAAMAELTSAANDPITRQAVGLLGSVASAFHSQSFYARAGDGTVDARMSVSLDREGRYSVKDLAGQSKDYRSTFAIVEPGGAMIADQQRLESLKLRVSTRATDALERIREDLTVQTQTVEKRGDGNLIVSVRPRRAAEVPKTALPVAGAEFASFLKSDGNIRSDDPRILEQARGIAGDDHDAWSVARKLADWTYKNLRWKRVDRASAVDTLATREADCVEFSQLFVSMARALGLPSRVVDGLAYSSGAFGGHAWVEVYAGRWIELDPTWGTDFVDATHIRSASGDLISYAALNLVKIEVVEAPRTVADYERDPRALAEKICSEMGMGNFATLAAALDAGALVDAYLGKDAWEKLDERWRAQFLATVPRLAYQLQEFFQDSGIADDKAEAHVLKCRQHGDAAEVILTVSPDFGESFVKLTLMRRGQIWALVDLTEVDTGFHVVKENLGPTIDAINAHRTGNGPLGYSDQLRIKLLMSTLDYKGALDVVEQALQKSPADPVLANLKASCLTGLKKPDEALALLTRLSTLDPPFAPAVYALATHFEESETDSEKQRAAGLFMRYIALEPDDPRAHSSLATILAAAGDATRAEAEYRAAATLDPRNQDRRLDLAKWLVKAGRIDEALGVIDEGAKQPGATGDLLATLISRSTFTEDGDAEAIAAAHPERIAASAEANLNLASIRARSNQPARALPLLKRALELKKDYGEAYNVMAQVHRKLKNWTAALASANSAIAINAKDGDAHYHRACALARLGRPAEAMTSLKRAIQLDEDFADGLEEEEDLKPLARLAAFKELIPKEEPAPPAEKTPVKAPPKQ